MPLVEVNHPLIKHHLSRLRDRHTPPAEFRQVVQRLAVLLAYEATKDLAIHPLEIETPLTRTTGQVLSQRIGLIPILRAGLGMVDPILNLIPTAEVWHLGLYRDETTARPVEYYSKLPPTKPVDIALVVDPMLATGHTAVAAIDRLKERGCRDLRLVCLLASPEGIAHFHGTHPEVPIWTAAIDSHLNEHGYIVPGLGDAGDRMFGTK